MAPPHGSRMFLNPMAIRVKEELRIDKDKGKSKEETSISILLNQPNRENKDCKMETDKQFQDSAEKKSFICEMCGKRFTENRKLVDHKVTDRARFCRF